MIFGTAKASVGVKRVAVVDYRQLLIEDQCVKKSDQGADVLAQSLPDFLPITACTPNDLSNRPIVYGRRS
jgi:hypothetical protein